MRIGIDMLAVQSPTSRHRGIGRLGLNLVGAMLERDRRNEYVLYTHAGLESDHFPTADNAVVRPAWPGGTDDSGTYGQHMAWLARTNPDNVEVLLLLSPQEVYRGYEPPPKPIAGPKIAAVIHDLIPLVFQDEYLKYPDIARRYRWQLQCIAGYDLLLANSEATRADFHRLLGVPHSRMRTIGAAGEGRFFAPPSPADEAPDRECLRALGIVQPFVFAVGAVEPRKDPIRLLEAFARMPEHLRASHQLVITCQFGPDEARLVRWRARQLGFGRQLVLTGKVDDEILRILYRRCAAFAFPSLYEGFGLPLLEAMKCGAAVIGGDNSSQPEVVGDAGLLAHANDPTDVAAKLALVLSDHNLAAELRRRAIERSAEFTWEAVAERALTALETMSVAPRGISRVGRPRVAVVATCRADDAASEYARRLADGLRQRYDLDFFHDAEFVPEGGLCPGETPRYYDYRLLRRRNSVFGYRCVLYHFGGTPQHAFAYRMLEFHPGVVTLHSFDLTGLIAAKSAHSTESLEQDLVELGNGRGLLHREVGALLREWSAEVGDPVAALRARGVFLNRRVFELAEAVLVNSSWALERVRSRTPEFEPKTRLLRVPTPSPPILDVGQTNYLANDGAAVLGLWAPNATTGDLPMLAEACGLIRRIAPTNPFFVTGPAAAGLSRLVPSNVRVVVPQTEPEFEALLGAGDVAVVWNHEPERQPVELLSELVQRGVMPLVASREGLPADLALRVHCGGIRREGVAGLARVLRALISEPPRPVKASTPDWDRAAEQFAELIEEVAARRLAAVRGKPASWPDARGAA